MKNIMMFMLVMAAILLTGCSVGFDFNSSSTKAEQFAEKADEFGDQVEFSRAALEKMEKKESLSSKDQKRLEKEMENLTAAIESFKDEEAPFLAKTAKKVAVKKLNEMEEVLSAIQEKAKEGTADREDIQTGIETLKDDLEFNLFGK